VGGRERNDPMYAHMNKIKIKKIYILQIGCGHSSSREPPWQVWSPEFKPKYHPNYINQQ
jgi:hypothetical protein